MLSTDCDSDHEKFSIIMKIISIDRLPRIFVETFLGNLLLIYAVNYAVALATSSQTFEACSMPCLVNIAYIFDTND